MSPPITPKQSHGLPSLVTIAGMIVWNGRLCGSRRLRCLSSSANSEPRFCITKPDIARHDARAEAADSCSG